jgi:hypothetical protein
MPSVALRRRDPFSSQRKQAARPRSSVSTSSLCFNSISCAKENGFVAEPCSGEPLQKINSREISRQCVAHYMSARRGAGLLPQPLRSASENATAACKHIHSRGTLMRKPENRCADCGGKLGLVSHHHWGLRFCRKACKDHFLAKSAREHARIRKWFGFCARTAA